MSDSIIKKQIADLAEHFRISATFHTKTTSTNDVAREGGHREADLIFAEEQTKGRGQRGNTWDSRPGDNLTFSIILMPVTLEASRQFMLSIAVSLALSDTLAAFDIEAQVKWPNDIYVDGRKLAGILIENDILGDKISRSIVGIGLNVNQKKFPPELPNPTSMALEAGHDFDRGAILRKFYDKLSIRYSGLISDYHNTLLSDYHERLYLFEREHGYTLPNGNKFKGIIRSVEPSGTLIVEREDGSFKGFLFKEIEF